ncbi:hypothetical protein EON79_01795 [bacterium]|nr:MAG: hypothetical protein EON79_01795 [bacterium]
MRSYLIALTLLPAIVGAQSLPYRRVEALGTKVPDGRSFVHSMLDSGWSLIQSDAPNLVNPSRYPAQFYFRSPEGTLTRLPLEKAGIDLRFGVTAVLAPDASFALIGGPFSGLVRVDREGLATRVYSNVVQGGNLYPMAIAGNDVFLSGFTIGLSKMDLTSGQVTQFDDYPTAGFRNASRITPDGTKAIYEVGMQFVLRNLANDITRTWDLPAGIASHSLDSSGRYVWFRRPESVGAGPMLVRHDLYTGTELTYPDRGGSAGWIVESTERFVFFGSTASLSPDDDNTTTDVYAYDRRNDTLSLVTDRKGSRRAAGDIERFTASPNGSRLMFTTATPAVSELPSNLHAQLYARSTVRYDTVPALVAKTAGGSEAFAAVQSRNGQAVLWSRFAAGQWSIRSVVDGQPTRIMEGQVRTIPLDVTDDGRKALWMQEGSPELWFSVDGVIRTLNTGGFVAAAGRIDPKTGTPLILGYKNDAGGAQSSLLRFNTTTGAGTRIDTDVPVESNEFDADAGRVAWMVSDGVRVFDLTTGNRVVIPVENYLYYGPRLTADGLYVAVAHQTATGDPDKTRLYRTTDGQFRRTLPYGLLQPDGKWLVDPVGLLVFVETGASVVDWIEESVRSTGEPVGPERTFFRGMVQSGDLNLGDVWRYRGVALTRPRTDFFTARALPKGQVELESEFRKAGLENANTWTEYRIDGTGPWRRMKVGSPTVSIRLPDGYHTFDARTSDELGRIENRTYRRVVLTDGTPPVFANFRVERSSGALFLLLDTDARTGTVSVTFPDGSVQTGGASGNGETLRIRVTGLAAGQTYKAKFTLRDTARNEVVTPEYTFQG